MRRVTLFFLILFFGVGCSGGGGGGVGDFEATSPQSTGGQGGPVIPAVPTSPTAEILVRHDLALRSVPSSIDRLRFIGTSASGQTLYGPVDHDRQAELVLTGVPIEVVRLRIEYYEGSLLRGFYLAPCRLLAGQRFIITDPDFESVEATLERLELSPAVLKVPSGLDITLRLIGIFNDGVRQDLTESATWQVNSEQIAKVSQNRLEGLSVGNTTLVVQVGGLSLERSVEVTPALLQEIQLSPPSPQLPVGDSLKMTAIGRFSDGSTLDLSEQVDWTSSNDALAEVSDDGTVTSLGEGQVQISVSRDNISQSVDLQLTSAELRDISIEVEDEIPLGLTRQATAFGHYSDHSVREITTDATWTVSPSDRAVVTNGEFGGEVTAQTEGLFDLRCDYHERSSTTQILASPAVLQTVEIVPADPSVPLGLSIELAARGHFSDGSMLRLSGLTWTSSNLETAVIDSDGVATGLLEGQAEITAQLGDGASGSTTLTVSPSVPLELIIEPQSIEVPAGVTGTVRVSARMSGSGTRDFTDDVSWTSSAPEIALVDPLGPAGHISTFLPGEAVLTAQLGSLEADLNVVVTAPQIEKLVIEPELFDLPTSYYQEYQAFAVYTDGNRVDATLDVVWESTDNSVAKFSQLAGQIGRLQTLALGETTIRATLPNTSIEATERVVVRPARLVSMTITNLTPQIAMGQRGSMRVFGKYDDNRSLAIDYLCTFTSSDSTFGTVGGVDGKNPRYEGRKVGSFSITVQPRDSELSTVVNITVTPAVLKDFVISPKLNNSMPPGTSHRFRAYLVYTDEKKIDVTESAVWVSSNAANVSVDKGLVKMLAGSAKITAYHGAQFDDNNVNRTLSRNLLGLRLTPASPILPSGLRSPIRATGLYSSDEQWNLSHAVVWSSSDTSVATIDTSGADPVLQAHAPGSTTIKARHASTGVEISTTLTVTGSTLVGLQIDEGPTSIKPTHHRRFLAFGRFSDGSLHDLGERVVWSFAGTALSSVTNGGLHHGTVVAGSSPETAELMVSDTLSPATTTESLNIVEDPLVGQRRIDIVLRGQRPSIDSRSVYALSASALTQYSLPELEILNQLPLSNATCLDLSPDGSTVWVGHSNLGVLTKVDTSTFESAEVPLQGITSVKSVSVGQSDRLFVLSGSQLHVLDTGTGTTLKVIQDSVNLGSAAEVKKDRTSNALLVAVHGISPSSVARYEMSGNTPVFKESSRVGSNGRSLRLNPKGGGFFFATGGGNSLPDLSGAYLLHYLSIFDLTRVFSTHHVEEAYPSDSGFTPDGLLGYSLGGTSNVNADHPKAAVVNLADGNVLGFVPLDYIYYGTGPEAIEVTPNGEFLISYSGQGNLNSEGVQLSVIRLR